MTAQSKRHVRQPTSQAGSLNITESCTPNRLRVPDLFSLPVPYNAIGNFLSWRLRNDT